MIKAIKKHYHWMIAVVLFLLMAVRGGIANNLSSLHLIPVTEALNISRAQYSLAASAGSVMQMLITLFSGALILRFGYRSLLTVFLLVMVAAYALMGSADSYMVFLAGYMMYGISNGICGEAGATRLVSAWFHKYRGTVLGLISSATGLGGSVMCILQTAAMESGTYRSSYFLAAFLLAICAVLALLFIRTHPSKMGLLPYGDGERIVQKKREHGQDHWHGFPMKQLVRRPTFYMMLLGTFVSCVFSYFAFSVVVPHLQDRGLTVLQASSLQSVLMLCLTGTKILTGYLCDAIGAKRVTLICLAFLAISLVLLALAEGMLFALIAVVVYALALPVTTLTIPMLAMSLFGYQAQTEYIGIFIAMVSAGSIVASPVSNAFYDKIGAYGPVFLTAAALIVPLMGMYLWMYRLADKDRKKLEAIEAVQ